MSLGVRKLLMFVLVVCFVGQTWLVYSDPAGTEHSFSSLALEGQEIWHGKNCQSCHQIYGFGGFLGPDLTNAIGSLSRERLEAILTDGAGQMPAFGLNDEEQRGIEAFLRELDATGVSQPKLGEAVAPAEFFRQITETTESLGAELARGREIVLAQNCIACHLPNGQSVHRSTDLTLIGELVGRERVQEILRVGIAGTAMPRLAISAEDGAAVYAYLRWLGERGEEIRTSFENLPASEKIQLSRIPWFEYP